VAALLLAGCGGDANSGPPRILYGEDICDHCRMVISERRHAAGAGVAGREHRFDDPGCLQAFLVSRDDPAPVRTWVHDENGAWLRTEEAWFVVDPERGTPMASGILAFGSKEAAATAAAAIDSTQPSGWLELPPLPEAP
jgi:copper chaperone NosL